MPMSMTAPTPPPATPTAPLAPETPEEREDRIEITVRSNAEIFRLKSELTFEEKEHARERSEAQEQFARLNSRIERLEQDLIGLNGAFHTWCSAESEKARTEKLLDLVKRGLLMRNAAAAPDEVKQYAEREIEKCQMTK
jgi:hypothetical protein